MAIPSVPKAASKFINIAAPSIQCLLRPSAAATTHLFQSAAAADPRLFNLPQPENERTDSPGVHLNLREISFAMNSLQPLGYSAARKAAPSEDDFSEGDEEEDGDVEDFIPDSSDFSEDVDDDEENEDGDEEEIQPPRRSRK